eukprot:GHVU01075878.1.p1 GENE.GHVU01075878.1~~GHVU01075878.1.p1  ORF type:complete len:192 (-),score=14.37 GHVU01075878.1:120-695(-)
MLSGLASYLWGAPAEEEPTIECPETGPAACTVPTEANGVQTDDNDWVLVDKPNGREMSRLETSSMENLLIEHPSMSVYAPRGRQCSSGVDSDQSSEGSMEVEEQPPSRSHMAPHPMSLRHPPRRPKVVAQRAGLIAQAESVKSVQIAQQRQTKKKVSRNQLDRTNRLQVTRGKVCRRHQHINQPRCSSSRQ